MPKAGKKERKQDELSECRRVHLSQSKLSKSRQVLRLCQETSGALDELAGRTIRMPGAMCGQWGICGSVASVGAALAVIHGTGPLSTDRYYKDHMAYASSVIAKMSKIGGARCCKRNAFLSLSFGARFVRETYGIPMQTADIVCTFSDRNAQCLVSRCPFHAHTGADD